MSLTSVARTTTIDLEIATRDAFCLFYDAQEKTVKALNGSGHSPAKLSIDYVRSQGVLGGKIPASNLNSVTVPGNTLISDENSLS